MLTVYSTHGSPGASTTAVYLAAQWASSGRQVLLIETDSAAGSLGQKLGIQFTPGTASFAAAGKAVTAANLIEHAQDVLFNDFHVMPTPSNPSGAKTVADKFARLGEELRDISDSEMAIIVDGGRLTADTRTSELTTSAAAVLIVARDNAQLPSLEHLSGTLVDDPAQPGPLGLVATVGPSPLKDAEWGSNHGLRLVGSVELSSERGTDLSMFMPKGKRKSRKLRSSLEKLADALYEYACPASAAAPRARVPANRPAAVETPAEVQDATAPAEPNDLVVEPPPPVAPAAPPPLAPAAAPVMPSAQAPSYEQHPYPAPGHALPGSPSAPYSQPPPPAHGYEQPAYPQPDYPPPDYPQHGHPQPSYPQQGYPDSAYAPPPYGQPPPAHQPAPQAPEPPPLPPAETPTVPTGSFRSWAVHLFGESAGGDPDDKRSDPGAGATA